MLRKSFTPWLRVLQLGKPSGESDRELFFTYLVLGTAIMKSELRGLKSARRTLRSMRVPDKATMKNLDRVIKYQQTLDEGFFNQIGMMQKRWDDLFRRDVLSNNFARTQE